jgi:hypothetical protein
MPVRGARVAEQGCCPGYSTSIPAVLETASAHTHWDKGHLRERLHGDEATPILLSSIEVYAAALRSAESYFMKPEKDRD